MKLKVEIFSYAGEVTSFVNTFGVKVQSISVKSNGDYVLFYWAEG